MKIAGIIFIAVGLIDLGGSWLGFDLWYTLGFNLPEIIWRFTSWIELGIGFFLYNIGDSDTEENNLDD